MAKTNKIKSMLMAGALGFSLLTGSMTMAAASMTPSVAEAAVNVTWRNEWVSKRRAVRKGAAVTFYKDSLLFKRQYRNNKWTSHVIPTTTVTHQHWFKAYPNVQKASYAASVWQQSGTIL